LIELFYAVRSLTFNKNTILTFIHTLYFTCFH